MCSKILKVWSNKFLLESKYRNLLRFKIIKFQQESTKGEKVNYHGMYMSRVPNHIFVVYEDLCYGCGACIALCPVNVLDLNNKMIIVDEPNCTHCELCIPSCPVFALDIVRVD